MRLCMLVIFLSTTLIKTVAQVPDLNLKERSLEQELSGTDSLHIFLLLDSLIQNAEFPKLESGSQLGIRTGYNSNITATGRPFAFGNYGLTSGLTFIHNSGAFGDLSTYYSNQYKPSFFLTTATLGYLFTTGKKMSFAAEYSHFFYNLTDTAYVAYTNNAGATAFYNKKLLSLRLDYAFYFGNKIGHRLNPSIGLNFRKDKFAGLTRIMFYPMLSVLLGIETISSYKAYTTNRMEILFRIRRGLPLFYEQKKNIGGIMNYALVLPISLSLKSWTLALSYTYNIPKALNGETLTMTNSGYFSGSLTKYLSFNKKNKD